MKKLVFLLIGVLCSAHSYSQNDSTVLKQLNQLEQINKENTQLLKTADKLEKKKQNLIDRLRTYILNLKVENRAKEKEIMAGKFKNQDAIKAENINGPVEEIQIPDGVDSVRGSFFYRLFNRSKFIMKPYKIINNEKIYLD